jgi:hypothetical protein
VDQSSYTSGTTNLDDYCGNDPINATDPSGLGGPVASGGNSTPIPAINWSADSLEAIQAEQKKVAAMTARDQQLYQQAWQALQSAANVQESLAAEAEMTKLYKQLQFDQEASQWLQKRYIELLGSVLANPGPRVQPPVHTFPKMNPARPLAVSPAGRLEYHLPGPVSFPGLSMAFISNDTVSDDYSWIRSEVSADSQKNIFQNVNSWDKIADGLKSAAPHSLDCIIFSGHQWGLGIGVDHAAHGLVFGATTLNPLTLLVTPEVLQLLRDKLAPGGVVYILSCTAGTESTNMQWLAGQIGHPVVANEAGSFAGNYGRGDWVVAYPP